MDQSQNLKFIPILYTLKLQKLSPNETLDMEPYKYEVPPLPLESAPPEEPPVGDLPPEEGAESAEPTEEAPPGKFP